MHTLLFRIKYLLHKKSVYDSPFLYAGVGCGMVVIIIAGWRGITREDFYVAHHFSALARILKIQAFFLSGIFVLLGAGLARSRVVPEKMLRIIAIVFAAVFFLIALCMHPSRSQDLYWALLLGKGFARHGLNPYLTLPSALAGDPWAYPVLTWKDIPMLYGPMWALFVSGVSWLATSLAAALHIVKFSFAALGVLAGYLYWKMLELERLSAKEKIIAFMLLAWNPFIFQTAFVDAHNDFFILVSILASYFFLLKKRYAYSALALVFGGFVKYVPWLLLPIPLIALLREKKRSPLQLAGMLCALIAASLGTAIALYAPFGGISYATVFGPTKRIADMGLATEFLPGTAALYNLFSLTFAHIRWMGLAAAVAVIIACALKKKYLAGYTLPFIIIFFFATPWFQPWYALWIFPLLILSWPIWATVLASIFLLLTPELISPYPLSLAMLVGVVWVYFLKWTWNRAAQPENTLQSGTGS